MWRLGSPFDIGQSLDLFITQGRALEDAKVSSFTVPWFFTHGAAIHDWAFFGAIGHKVLGAELVPPLTVQIKPARGAILHQRDVEPFIKLRVPIDPGEARVAIVALQGITCVRA